MPRISEKRRIENQLASTMEAVTLAMLLDSDSESEEADACLVKACGFPPSS